MSQDDVSRFGRFGRILTEEERKKILKTLTDAEEQRKKEEENKYKPKSEEVGTCHCGGKIVRNSYWEIAVPDSEIRYGGENPKREVVNCSCKKCGQVYDPNHKRFER